ncbi:S-adenosylmethionine:tRNA ribosyltransferase-isomerase [soil metagenome]
MDAGGGGHCGGDGVSAVAGAGTGSEGGVTCLAHAPVGLAPFDVPADLAPFDVPAHRIPTTPPEHRGIPRDRVRLLVADPHGTSHARFADLGHHLRAGDLLVVNTSATRHAAIDGTHPKGRVTVHLATDRGDGRWVVELRRLDGRGPVLDASPGDLVAIAGGGHLRLHAPDAAGPGEVGVRLWRAAVTVPGGSVEQHMQRLGRPISYGPHAARLLLGDHQTVFARHPGSAEMASAARPFSQRLVTELISRGVLLAPLVLHAGVSSQEAGEPPGPEWFDVPAATADLVQHARGHGGRVIAVGTTVTRALQSAWRDGRVRAARGWTDLAITPCQPVAAVDGLISGWHEADASHLQLLQAVVGAEALQRAYAAALAGPYLWHEFGDSALLLR